MCVEGPSNSLGNHGDYHDKLCIALGKFGKENPGKVSPNGEIAYSDMSGVCAEVATSDGSGAEHCSKDCIKAQLDAYYQPDKSKDPKLLNQCGCNKSGEGHVHVLPQPMPVRPQSIA